MSITGRDQTYSLRVRLTCYHHQSRSFLPFAACCNCRERKNILRPPRLRRFHSRPYQAFFRRPAPRQSSCCATTTGTGTQYSTVILRSLIDMMLNMAKDSKPRLNPPSKLTTSHFWSVGPLFPTHLISTFRIKCTPADANYRTVSNSMAPLRLQFP